MSYAGKGDPAARLYERIELMEERGKQNQIEIENATGKQKKQLQELQDRLEGDIKTLKDTLTAVLAAQDKAEKALTERTEKAAQAAQAAVKAAQDEMKAAFEELKKNPPKVEVPVPQLNLDPKVLDEWWEKKSVEIRAAIEAAVATKLQQTETNIRTAIIANQPDPELERAKLEEERLREEARAAAAARGAARDEQAEPEQAPAPKEQEPRQFNCIGKKVNGEDCNQLLQLPDDLGPTEKFSCGICGFQYDPAKYDFAADWFDCSKCGATVPVPAGTKPGTDLTCKKCGMIHTTQADEAADAAGATGATGGQ